MNLVILRKVCKIITYRTIGKTYFFF
ncbi:hypothetical protein LCGC14_2956980, partial [marine sediment metagenome]